MLPLDGHSACNFRRFATDSKSVSYDDAGHAFENPNNKDGYRAANAVDAWKRTLNFLAETLKK